MVLPFVFPVCPPQEWRSHFALVRTNYFTTFDQALLWINILFVLSIRIWIAESLDLLASLADNSLLCLLLLIASKWSRDSSIVRGCSFTWTNLNPRDVSCFHHQIVTRCVQKILRCIFSGSWHCDLTQSLQTKPTLLLSLHAILCLFLAISKFLLPSKAWSHHTKRKKRRGRTFSCQIYAVGVPLLFLLCFLKRFCLE